LRTHALVLFLLAALPAAADAADDALVEKVVIRNQLFTVSHRFELGLNFGAAMLSRLTDHYTFNLSFGYNISESFAVELLAGASYTQHTSLADDVATNVLATSTSSTTKTQDLSDLWEMSADAVVGLRWQPIYGKVGVFAEIPIHFQAYVFAGAGAGWFNRTSVVLCNHKTGSTCDEYYSQSEVNFLASFALGFRFFIPVIGMHHAIHLEARDFSYLDSYLVNIDRAAALNAANPTGGGTPAASPGITNLTEVQIGYTYIF
jgi:outer membrane beta-barrel protein